MTKLCRIRTLEGWFLNESSLISFSNSVAWTLDVYTCEKIKSFRGLSDNIPLPDFSNCSLENRQKDRTQSARRKFISRFEYDQEISILLQTLFKVDKCGNVPSSSGKLLLTPERTIMLLSSDSATNLQSFPRKMCRFSRVSEACFAFPRHVQTIHPQQSYDFMYSYLQSFKFFACGPIQSSAKKIVLSNFFDCIHQKIKRSPLFRTNIWRQVDPKNGFDHHFEVSNCLEKVMEVFFGTRSAKIISM